MKFTLSWLKQHLETYATLEEICEKLTAIGLEVEDVKDPSKALAPFIVAEVLTAEKHPQADRLKVTTVNTGKETLQVICGAPNCRAGLKVVLARPGDVIPQSGDALKKGVIRGLESQGMLCSLAELCLAEDSQGIMELPSDAPIGAPFASYMKYDDPVIEINLTPNRPDCAGVYGIARDLAAAGLGRLKPLETAPIKGQGPSPLKVSLDFPDADQKDCPLFAGRLIRNIKNGVSPEWLQKRLVSIGLRPISALVDITNYLTFDYARPLHVFDAQKIKGQLWVRPAKGGETFTALDGNTYTMKPGMTIIGDDNGMLSLAGIMGGESSKCEVTTRDVFIESAYFDRIRTARTGRELNISSDARYRFERGIDPLSTLPGLEIATRLVLEICGTPESVVSDTEVAGSIFSFATPIPFSPGACVKRTGVDVPEAEQEKILTVLGFQVKHANGQLLVTPPSWRPDIEGAADLVEEIIRVKGFDHIKPTPLPRTETITRTAIDFLDQRAHIARRALASQGLMEAVTWSFMPEAIAGLFGHSDVALRLKNPISSDLNTMRPSILGNLILAAKRNADRGFEQAALFEIGPVFSNATPEGQAIVATAIRTGISPRHWTEPQRKVDAFDAKADAIAALTAIGAPTASLQITTDAPSYYHPGRSGSLRLGPTLLATFGEIHPAILKQCDIEGPVIGCEIFLAASPQSRSSSTAKPLLKLEPLQPVKRDFAFVVDRSITASKLIKAVKDADKLLIREVTVFDVYEGEHVEAGKKSVALNVTLQPIEKTLTDSDLEGVAARITTSVIKTTGATLRG